MAGDERGKKCAHELCNCRADKDSNYCSPYCENAADSGVTEIKCDCRHPACG